MSTKHPRWAAPGDVNAFFGLMLDNIADLVLAVGLLSVAFEFPTNIALSYMVPGTAIGVLVGDLLFTWMAIRMARRTGRNDVTAMPLGLDTPSTFGMVLFVVGPAFSAARANSALTADMAALYAWQIGVCAIFISGVFKIACAAVAGWVRSVVPRAGLLGSLTAIALVLISFLPLVEISHYPVAGFAALAVVLTALVARVGLPFRIPGALGALLVGSAVYYLMLATGTLGHPPAGAVSVVWFPTGWLEAFSFGWVEVLPDSLRYLPVVIPFALATVIGGIDCTESAAAAGDVFDTRKVIGVDAIATLVGALCGGVIQTTPYIGHPAYKAMGGRSAYTLAVALFVGAAGVVGYFGYLYLFIPKAAVFPILIFIGLEITAQSFHATPKLHYPAVALACVPAMAALVMIYADQVVFTYVGSYDLDQVAESNSILAVNLQTIRMLSGGFILTSLLWGATLASLLDRRLRRAAAYLTVAAVCSLFGVIHSPLPGGKLVLPWQTAELPDVAAGQTPVYLAGAYGVMAVLLLVWSWLLSVPEGNS